MKVHTKYKYFNQYQIDKFFNTKANKIQTMEKLLILPENLSSPSVTSGGETSYPSGEP
jgi:hypothetical protein